MADGTVDHVVQDKRHGEERFRKGGQGGEQRSLTLFSCHTIKLSLPMSDSDMELMTVDQFYIMEFVALERSKV